MDEQQVAKTLAEADMPWGRLGRLAGQAAARGALTEDS